MTIALCAAACGRSSTFPEELDVLDDGGEEAQVSIEGGADAQVSNDDAQVSSLDAHAADPDARASSDGGQNVDGAACPSGVPCNPGGNVCQTGTTSCSSGAAVCIDVTNTASGTPCGVNQLCNDGACILCAAGILCNPGGNPCLAGVTSCASGSMVCGVIGDVTNGTACGTNEVCFEGTCTTCGAGAACHPNGNACESGTTSCSTGQAVCVSTGEVPNGEACEAGLCCAGECVACSTTANATHMCSASACISECNPGFTSCGGACVDATSDSNACGPSCIVCPGGSMCSNSTCVSPGSTVKYGNVVPYAPCNPASTFLPDYLLGELITVPTDITVTALGVIASPAEPTNGVEGIIALYTDAGGSPSARVAQTASTTIGPGDNLISVVSSVRVQAGSYWIVAEYTAATGAVPVPCVDTSMSNVIDYIPVSYGSVPDPFGTPTIYMGKDINYYVVGIE